jgi:hypothetical protein
MTFRNGACAGAPATTANLPSLERGEELTYLSFRKGTFLVRRGNKTSKTVDRRFVSSLKKEINQ